MSQSGSLGFHLGIQSIITRQLVSGVAEDQVSLKEMQVYSENPRDILEAWSYGMKTNWIGPDGKIMHNILPVEYMGPVRNKKEICLIAMKDNGSIVIQDSIPDEALAALSEQTQTTFPKDHGERERPSRPQDLVRMAEEIKSSMGVHTPGTFSYMPLIAEQGLLRGQEQIQVGLWPTTAAMSGTMFVPWSQASSITNNNFNVDGQNFTYTETAPRGCPDRSVQPAWVPPITPGLIASTVRFMDSLKAPGQDPLIDKPFRDRAQGLFEIVKVGQQQEPAFQKDYANFCADLHAKVENYHNAWAKYFEDQANKFPENSQQRKSFEGWNNIAKNCAKVAHQDMDINRGIAKGWKAVELKQAVSGVTTSLTSPHPTTRGKPAPVAVPLVADDGPKMPVRRHTF